MSLKTRVGNRICLSRERIDTVDSDSLGFILPQQPVLYGPFFYDEELLQPSRRYGDRCTNTAQESGTYSRRSTSVRWNLDRTPCRIPAGVARGARVAGCDLCAFSESDRRGVSAAVQCVEGGVVLFEVNRGPAHTLDPRLIRFRLVHRTGHACAEGGASGKRVAQGEANHAIGTGARAERQAMSRRDTHSHTTLSHAQGLGGHLVQVPTVYIGA